MIPTCSLPCDELGDRVALRVAIGFLIALATTGLIAGLSGGEEIAGALALFALLFVWQPPHFWALALLSREEYERAGLPVLPVVCGPQMTRRWILCYTVMLLPISLLPYPLEIVGLGYAVTAAVLGIGFVGLALGLRSTPDDERPARGLFRYSILYLGALVVALLLNCAC